MDYSLQLIFVFLCSSLCFLKLCFSGHGKYSKLPPGPKPLPVLGNILQLSDKPHRALAEISNTYGPLMYVKLGKIHTLVVSSSAMATEVLLKHDLAFSSRKVPDAARALDHNLHSVAWLPVSPKWRNLRKICAIHLFTVKSLDASQFLRQTKVHELLEYIVQCCKNGQAVGIAEVGFITSLNLLSNMLFSTNLASYHSEEAHELKDNIRQMMDSIGKPNLSDFFPLLSYFDPQGVRRDTTASFSKLFKVFDVMISHRLSADSLIRCAKGDVLQTLLEISKEDEFDLSLDDIKHLLLDLITAGTDTTSSTVEWAMTELLCNPSKMTKVQAELDEILGKEALVQESDIEGLPYLKAVVKETMRLHPAAPLLLPHKAKDDIQLCNNVIPKDTQVLVNAWAIGRDPQIWENPSEFLPERFLESDIDMRGQHMELIPFGAGRRICPGMSLAYRMVHLLLASLVHGFGWKLSDGLRKEDVDMNERFGVTLEKAKPLLAVPYPKGSVKYGTRDMIQGIEN